MDEKYYVKKDIYNKVNKCLNSMSSNIDINDNLASDMLLNYNKKKNNKYAKHLCADELDSLDYLSANSNLSCWWGKNYYETPKEYEEY